MQFLDSPFANNTSDRASEDDHRTEHFLFPEILFSLQVGRSYAVSRLSTFTLSFSFAMLSPLSMSQRQQLDLCYYTTDGWK